MKLICFVCRYHTISQLFLKTSGKKSGVLENQSSETTMGKSEVSKMNKLSLTLTTKQKKSGKQFSKPKIEIRLRRKKNVASQTEMLNSYGNFRKSKGNSLQTSLLPNVY